MTPKTMTSRSPPRPAGLLDFSKVNFSKRRPRGLVDQEAHFYAENLGHAGRASASLPTNRITVPTPSPTS